MPERTKSEKVEKHVANLQDKQKCVMHMRSLEEALNQELVLKNVRRVNKLNQKVWLKPYINMNTEVRKMQKMILGNNFLSR